MAGRGSVSRRRDRGRRRGWSRWAEVAVGAALTMGFLGAGAWQALDLYLLSSRGVVVQARMIEEHHGRYASIEVEFTTRSGELVRGETSNFTDGDLQNFPDIVYDPQDPSRFQSAAWGFDYVPPALLLAGGAVLGWITVHTWRHGPPDWLRRD